MAGLLAASTLAGCREEAVAPAETFRERRYEARVSSTSDGLRASIQPRAPWTLALEFPTRLEVGASARLEPSVHTERRLEFDLPRRRGPVPEHPDPVVAVFGVCQGELCQRVDHPVVLPSPASR